MRRGVLLLAVPLGLLLLGAVALANVYDYAGPALPLATGCQQRGRHRRIPALTSAHLMEPEEGVYR